MKSKEVIPGITERRVRVSDLAKSAFCMKRSKLEAQRHPSIRRVTEAMRTGSNFHYNYSLPYKSFDRRVLFYKLDAYPRVFERSIPGIVVRGVPDDYRVVVVCRNGLREIQVQIIEVKTTSRKRLWVNEEAIAVLQCQIYMWLMTPYLEELEYQLCGHSWVEIYSQKDGHLIKRIKVYPLPNPEEVITGIVCAWNGLMKMKYPPLYICKKCPRNVKERCSRWR